MWETQIQSVIPLTAVSISLKEDYNDFKIKQKCSQVCLLLVLPGDDGVFSINKTSGCITLLTSPIYLKREIFNIKVKVSCSSFIHSVLL